jgi:hypothetical protein
VNVTLLERLARIPRLLLTLIVVALFLGGAFAPAPIGPILLVVIAALLGWLTTLTWPTATPGARVLRVLVVFVLLVFAASRT